MARRWLGVLLVAAAACGGGATNAAAPTTTARPTTTTSTTAPTTTTTTVVTTTTTAPPPTTAPPVTGLQPGASGAEVAALQQRLADLGYWLGAVDGNYGGATAHAVTALQKVAGVAPDGIVGPATQVALDQGVRPIPLSTVGAVVEIDLARQVLLVVRDGVLVEVFDTSTGRRAGATPAGNWQVEREIDGYRRAPLGTLYRPKYFRGGVAIHGFTSVPSHPASHGCVRLTYAAMDHVWEANLAPVSTPVWVY